MKKKIKIPNGLFRKGIFALLSFLFLSVYVSAQERNVSGVVTDESGEVVPGVNVVIQGTNTGTITDMNGNYELSGVTPSDVLVFSFVGMDTQEQTVGDRSTIDVQMQSGIELDEVVAVGYGTAKKRDITGSVASVSNEKLTSFSSASVEDALQGAASGLQVSGSSGSPGAVSRILIRGTNSLSSATEPLWVIDGVIVGSNLSNTAGTPGGGGGSAAGVLSTINPADIESVEVLKDAAATSIYGQRGSNGVILVTTKSGKAGESQTNVSVSTGITQLTKHPDEFNFANTSQWFDIMETSRANQGLDPVEFDPVIHGNINDIDNDATLTRAQALATNVDWFDQILRNGTFQDVNLSTSGGSEKGTYYLSGNYRKDESPVKNSSLERFSVRSNMDYGLTENLKLDVKLNFSYVNNDPAPDGGRPGGNNNSAMGGFQQAFDTPPWMPVYDPENPNLLWNTLSGYNLVASNDPDNIRSESMKYRMIGSAGATYNIPGVEGLSLRGEASVDLHNNHGIVWTNTMVRRESKYAFDDKTQYKHLAYNVRGNYENTFGDHSISLVVGSESEMISGERSYIEGDELTGTHQQLGNPGNVTRKGSWFGTGEEYLRGYFGRGSYKFMDRYILGMSFRRDGTSNFIEENRWGTFSALSAGWILSDETFMSNIDVINLLKLRGSFGQTGNANIPGGLDTPHYNDWMRYGETGHGVSAGTAFSGIAVTDVSWETTNSIDYGVDFGLYNNRVQGSLAYYIQNVEDMLLAVPIPNSAGVFGWGNSGSIWGNIGDMKNYGIEFNISTVNVNQGGFKWSTDFNFTTNQNEILKLSSELDDQGTGITTGNTMSRTGGSLGEWYLTEFAGIDPDYGYPLIYQGDNDRFLRDEEGEYTDQKNPNFGKRYVDPETGEHVVIPATDGNMSNNKIIHEGKTGMPTFFGGLGNTLSFKGFDFTFNFSFAGGHYLFDNATRKLHDIAGRTNVVNNLEELTWSESNNDASLPLLTLDHRYDLFDDEGNLVEEKANFNTAENTDQYLVKGDYIRLRTLRLNYTFSKNIVDQLRLKGLSAYVSANNLWTWTAEFDGYDPEGANLSGGAQSRNLSQGAMGVGLPSLTSYNFGINITF